MHGSPRNSTPPPRRRRRSGSTDPLRKLSIRMHQTVADAIRALVDAGEVPSTDAFIEDAVIAQLRERRRQRVYAAYEEAASDPVFMAEHEEMNRALDAALGDGLPRPSD